MAFKEIPSVTLKFASISAPKADVFKIVTNNSSVMYVYDAAIIPLLAKGLRVNYEVVTPPDDEYGTKLPNGTWTGLIKMVRQSEADFAVGGIAMTEERSAAVNFSYPYLVSENTFVTNNPEPHSLYFAVFHPFTSVVWILLAMLIITIPIISFIISRKKLTITTAIFITIGILLEEMPRFRMKKPSLKLLFTTWVIGAMILNYSYKSVLLSFLTVPQMVGIRDISDLSEAAKENSVKCFTYNGGFFTRYLFESNIESWKVIGECLESNPFTSRDIFFKYQSKKVFFGEKIYLKFCENDYYISKDSFFSGMVAFAYSKNFCCFKRLEQLIHRLSAFGLFQKSLDDEQFFFSLQMTQTKSSPSLRKLNLEDMSAAFSILMSGWILSFAILLAENFIAKFGI